MYPDYYALAQMSLMSQWIKYALSGAGVGLAVNYTSSSFFHRRESGRVIVKYNFTSQPNETFLSNYHIFLRNRDGFISSTLYKASDKDFILIDIWENKLNLTETSQQLASTELTLPYQSKTVCNIDTVRSLGVLEEIYNAFN